MLPQNDGQHALYAGRTELTIAVNTKNLIQRTGLKAVHTEKGMCSFFSDTKSAKRALFNRDAIAVYFNGITGYERQFMPAGELKEQIKTIQTKSQSEKIIYEKQKNIITNKRIDN